MWHNFQFSNKYFGFIISVLTLQHMTYLNSSLIKYHITNILWGSMKKLFYTEIKDSTEERDIDLIDCILSL